MSNPRFVGAAVDGTPAERIFDSYKAELFFIAGSYRPYAVIFTADIPKELEWVAIIFTPKDTLLQSNSGRLGIIGKLTSYYKEHGF